MSTEKQTVHYIADYGDWVRMADGRAATVTRANPAYNPATEKVGAYYDLMFKGGEELHVTHWAGDDYLFYGRRNDKTMPLFTVVDQEA